MTASFILVAGALLGCDSETPAPSTDGPAQPEAPASAALPDGERTQAAELAGQCASGGCWGDTAILQKPDSNSRCYLYPDLAVLVSQDRYGRTQVWKQDALTACPSGEADISWDGGWQGRVGDHLIRYMVGDSDYATLEVYLKETGSSALRLDLGQSTPKMMAGSVVMAQLTLTDWSCPPEGDPAFADCSGDTWQRVTQKHPSLSGQGAPDCSCANEDKIPLSMFRRSVTADFAIDLNADSLSPTLSGKPSCTCSL
jgi:hypothetical protein